MRLASIRQFRVRNLIGSVVIALSGFQMLAVSSPAAADQASSDSSLKRSKTWEVYDAQKMSEILRQGLDQLGVAPSEMDVLAEQFSLAIEADDSDSLSAFVVAVRKAAPIVDQLVAACSINPVQTAASIDPNTEGYARLEALPRSLRMTTRTWLGRELVRRRLYDEALPVVAEVDPLETVDPASTLFYRGACYHALLMKTEALSDLRRLLENSDDCSVRFVRTAQLMIADIKPLKEDSLDEISRLMTDVTRRLDLGRTDQRVKEQEQQIIDKLTKLIEKIEDEQKKQQQQQQQSGGQSGGAGGEGSPAQESEAAGGGGNGDVDLKNIKDRDGWGNLPPAERQQALQQISRDLPTHYREAIEAYFRKIATD